MRIQPTLGVLLTLLPLGCATSTATDGSAPAPTDAGTVDLGVLAPDATPLDGGAPDGGADSGGFDGALLPPRPLGDPFGDAGPLGVPAWVPVDVRTSSSCAPLVRCGGDVLGTWDVGGVCIEVPIGTALAACPGARSTVATRRARGRVRFDGTVARRIAQSEVQVDVFVPGLCASFAGGCGGIEAGIRAGVADSACRTAASGDCVCAARVVVEIDDTDGYSTATDEIVSATLGKRWAYCVDGAGLRYEDVTPAGPREPGIVSLGRRR